MNYFKNYGTEIVRLGLDWVFREDPEVYYMNSAFELAGDSNRVFILFWQIRLGVGIFAKPGKYTMQGLPWYIRLRNKIVRCLKS